MSGRHPNRRGPLSDADTAAALQRLFKLLGAMNTKVSTMALDLTAITAKIDQTNTNEAKALALIQELKTQVADLSSHKDDPAAMQAAIDALTSKLDSGGAGLAAAVGAAPSAGDTPTTTTDPATGTTTTTDPAAGAVPQPLHPGQPTPGVLDAPAAGTAPAPGPAA